MWFILFFFLLALTRWPLAKPCRSLSLLFMGSFTFWCWSFSVWIERKHLHLFKKKMPPGIFKRAQENGMKGCLHKTRIRGLKFDLILRIIWRLPWRPSPSKMFSKACHPALDTFRKQMIKLYTSICWSPFSFWVETLFVLPASQLRGSLSTSTRGAYFRSKMWIGIIKLYHSKCSVPSHSWNYYWNYCLPTTVFQVFRKNRSLFLWSLSQAAARSARNESKAYGCAAVCSWNTHSGATSGSPSAPVLLILKSNRSFVHFSSCAHSLISDLSKQSVGLG